MKEEKKKICIAVFPSVLDEAKKRAAKHDAPWTLLGNTNAFIVDCIAKSWK